MPLAWAVADDQEKDAQEKESALDAAEIDEEDDEEDEDQPGQASDKEQASPEKKEDSEKKKKKKGNFSADWSAEFGGSSAGGGHSVSLAPAFRATFYEKALRVNIVPKGLDLSGGGMPKGSTLQSKELSELVAWLGKELPEFNAGYYYGDTVGLSLGVHKNLASCGKAKGGLSVLLTAMDETIKIRLSAQPLVKKENPFGGFFPPKMGAYYTARPLSGLSGQVALKFPWGVSLAFALNGQPEKVMGSEDDADEQKKANSPRGPLVSLAGSVLGDEAAKKLKVLDGLKLAWKADEPVLGGWLTGADLTLSQGYTYAVTADKPSANDTWKLTLKGQKLKWKRVFGEEKTFSWSFFVSGNGYAMKKRGHGNAAAPLNEEQTKAADERWEQKELKPARVYVLKEDSGAVLPFPALWKRVCVGFSVDTQLKVMEKVLPPVDIKVGWGVGLSEYASPGPGFHVSLSTETDLLATSEEEASEDKE